VNSGRGRVLDPSAGRPRVLKFESSDSARCTCGTQLSIGATVCEVRPIPASLEYLFRRRSFCSPRCVQAFCLESLEILDSLDTPASKITIIDLHEFTMEVATMLVASLSS
jgi:hypothetical protein